MMQYLLYLPYITTLVVIHSHYAYPDVVTNHPKLYSFSSQRYYELTDNIEPKFNTIESRIKYYMAKFTTSKYGDMIFGNYSNYMECDRRIDFEEDYLDLYKKLPNKYKKYIKDTNDW